MNSVRKQCARAGEALANPFVVMAIVALMYVAKAVAKIAIGSHINSPMIAGDGYHNVADLFEALVVILVIFVARLPRSKEYPFGRQNIEFFSSLAIGLGLLFMALKFALASVAGLLALWPVLDEAVRSYLPLPAYLPLRMDAATFPWVVAVTAGSVVLSLVVSRYQVKVGKRSGHASLVADGEETASDGRIEAVTLFGVLMEYWLHAPWLEYPLALLVAFLVGRTGCQLLLSAWRVLLQHSIGIEHEEAILKICRRTPGVVGVTELKAFQVGHTAVCMVTVATRRELQVSGHIKYGITTAVCAYLTDQGFKEAEIHIRFQAPLPERKRVCFALLKRPEGERVALSLKEASHLVVCDVEDGKIIRTKEEPVPADPVALLVVKRVAALYVLVPDSLEAAILEAAGIRLVPSASYVPSVMGFVQ